MQVLSYINRVLLFLILTYFILVTASSFLIPLVFGIFFATVMAPMADSLQRHKFPELLTAFISTLIVFIFVGSILWVFIHQLNKFIAEIPAFRNQFESFIITVQNQVELYTNLTVEEQNQIWQSRSDEIAGRIEPFITGLFTDLLNAMYGFMLVLIYVFLLVLYRHKVVDFVMMYTREDEKPETKITLEKIGRVVYHYLWGRAKVMAFLGIMYYITFLIFGLPFALLLTIIGALITIIPYIGPLISGILPILFAMVYFENLNTILIFIGVVVAIQIVESYVFEPMIIGKEVRLNPLMVIIAIILGGMIWGIAGMILFVPLFAMFKIVSGKIEGLKPVSFLFGNRMKKTNQQV
jgi:predicted PurR-regulated permease PerM